MSEARRYGPRRPITRGSRTLFCLPPTLCEWHGIIKHTEQMTTDGDNRREQDAQLSQRDRAAGCVIVFAKSRRLELGDNILRTV